MKQHGTKVQYSSTRTATKIDSPGRSVARVILFDLPDPSQWWMGRLFCQDVWSCRIPHVAPHSCKPGTADRRALAQWLRTRRAGFSAATRGLDRTLEYPGTRAGQRAAFTTRRPAVVA